MSNINIAYPYASAIFKLAVDTKNLDQWLGVLSNLKEVASNKDFIKLVDNPGLSDIDKTTIILGFVQSDKSLAEHLLKELTLNSRLSILPEIYDIYHTKYLEKLGSLDAVIESAYKLSDNDVKDIEKTLSNKFGKDINCKVKLNSELLGGIKITLGDLVIDKSIQGNLDRLAIEINR